MEDSDYENIETFTLTELKKTFQVKYKKKTKTTFEEKKKYKRDTFFYTIINFETEDRKLKKTELINKLSRTATGLHKNIINLTILDLNEPKELRIRSEFANEGNLFKEVKNRRELDRPFTYSEIKKLAYQLISASLHLQRLNIVHLNLKLSSFVKLRDNLYKLTNFYLACYVEDVTLERLPDLANDFMSITGTGENLFSPEVLKVLTGDYIQFDPIKSDVYCLGLVLLGAACLDDLTSFRKMGIEARYLKIEKMISESIKSQWLKSILTNMLETNPIKRLDFEELFIKYLDFKPRPKYIHEETDISYCIKLKFVVLNPSSKNEKKVVRATKQFEADKSRAFDRELEFYSLFGSQKYILNLHYSDEASKTLDLDFHEHSLQDYLNGNKYFTLLFEEISKKFVSGLIEAFEFFENNGLVHGCIKPGHIMVTKGLHPKIIDFTSMVKYDPSQIYQVSNDEEYRATELIGRMDSNGVDLFKAEVFSLGLVIFQLFAGYYIKGLNTLAQRNILDQSLECFPIPEIQMILKKMLAPFPQDRPTFKNLRAEYQSLLKPS